MTATNYTTATISGRKVTFTAPLTARQIDIIRHDMEYVVGACGCRTGTVRVDGRVVAWLVK